MWINADLPVQRLFWELVVECLQSDREKYDKLLNPQSLFRMMESLGHVRNLRCCHLAGAFKLNRSVQERLELMLPVVNETVLFHKDQFAQHVAAMLRIVQKRPCHCLMRCALYVLRWMCEREPRAVAVLEGVHGFYMICGAAAEYTIDVKLCCLELVGVIMRTGTKGGLDDSVCALLSKLSHTTPNAAGKRRARSPTPSSSRFPATRRSPSQGFNECQRERPLSQSEEHSSLYTSLFNLMMECKAPANQIRNPQVLRWIVKLARKAGDDGLSTRILADLMALAEAGEENRAMIALTPGVAKWLLRLEETLGAAVPRSPLYLRAIKFHTSLICQRFPELFPFQFLLLQHQAYLLSRKAQAGASMRFLWHQVLESFRDFVGNGWRDKTGSLWRQVFALANSTFELLVVMLDDTKNRSLHLPTEIPQSECMGLAFDSLRLFDSFWTDALSPFDPDTKPQAGAKELLEKAQSALSQHAKLFGITSDIKAGLRERASVVFTLSRVLLMALRNDQYLALGSAVSFCYYVVVLLEHSCKIVGGGSEAAHMAKPFDESVMALVFALVHKFTGSVKGDMKIVAALSRILRPLLLFAFVPKSHTAEIYKKNFVCQDGELLVPLKLIPKVIAEPEAELVKIVSERCGSLAEANRKQLDGARERLAGSELAGLYGEITKSCAKMAELSRRGREETRSLYEYGFMLRLSHTHRKLMTETAGKLESEDKSARQRLRHHFVRQELRRRACVAEQARSEKRVKRWQGAWRDKRIFDTQEGPARLPYQLSAHQFSNSSRGVFTIRSRNVKYLTGEKCRKYFVDSRPESVYALLNAVVDPADFPKEKKKTTSLKAIDVEGDFAKILGGEDMVPLLEVETGKSDPAFKDYVLPEPLDCEMFTFLSARLGKVVLGARNGEGYIRFVYNVALPTEDEDPRFTFTYRRSADKKINKKWLVSDIAGIYKKQIIESKSGTEVAFTTGESVLLDFAGEEERDLFCAKLVKLHDKLCKERFDLVFDGMKTMEKSHLTEDWRAHNISTLDYLLGLNAMASRSFNNPAQYPICPWVLRDHTSSRLVFELEESYRDLSKSVGMMGSPARAEEFRKHILHVDELVKAGFNYGSHYSNHGIVLQFTMRVHPFYEGYVKFLKGYDNPDRMFHSMDEAFHSACENTQDVCELIPEFFVLAEILLNSEGHNFGERTDDHAKVDHVLLPPWASGNPYTFVSAMRKALEHDCVDRKLHRWIDLVFGFQQRGKEAEKISNVFHPLATEPAKVLMSCEEGLRDGFRIQAFLMGQTPQQLFSKPHPPRLQQPMKPLCDKHAGAKIYGNNPAFQAELRRRSGSFSDSGFLPKENINEEWKHRVGERIVAIRALGDSATGMRFLMVSATGLLLEGTAEVGSTGKRKGSANSIVQVMPQPYDSGYFTPEGYCMSTPLIGNNYPIAIVRRKGAEQIVQAGYLNGTIRITPLWKRPLNTITLEPHNAPVTCLKVDSTERLGVTGDASGECIVHAIVDSATWTVEAHMCDHCGAVSWVDISGEMQLFVTAGVDGTANLYTRSRRPKLIRTFRHPQNLPITYVNIRH